MRKQASDRFQCQCPCFTVSVCVLAHLSEHPPLGELVLPGWAGGSTAGTEVTAHHMGLAAGTGTLTCC